MHEAVDRRSLSWFAAGFAATLFSAWLPPLGGCFAAFASSFPFHAARFFIV